MKDRDEVKVVNDQRGSPTWTFDLAKAIITLIGITGSGKVIPYGIYHFTNEGEITWSDFAREIYAQGRALGILTRDCEVNPCIGADFPAKVKRPSYSVLDKTKIKAALGITIPVWDESLRKFLQEHNNA
jgi:dTDP-4-dehydrorhamnose reductase